MRLGTALSLVTIASGMLAESLAAHVAPAPTFLYSGRQETVTLVAPNERDARMNGLSVTVPSDVTIVDALDSDRAWPGSVRGASAEWEGCCVAAGVTGSFPLTLLVDGEPRSVTLEVRQRYPDGETTRWPVQLAVLPPPEQSGSLATTLAVGALGLVVTVGVVGLAWLRRSR
jgi:hypothetical protein